MTLTSTISLNGTVVTTTEEVVAEVGSIEASVYKLGEKGPLFRDRYEFEFQELADLTKTSFSYLKNLFIKEEFRGKGFAKTLRTEMIQNLKKETKVLVSFALPSDGLSLDELASFYTKNFKDCGAKEIRQIKSLVETKYEVYEEAVKFVVFF